ncbi:nitronate monooxygenase [Jatrophihabitans sp.]|uniref:nitronate monooxygenase n=1 Tax=Jatrophihabitans sp. TaxID=1932789 RepID=UPI002CA9CA91|nr:nitronate monooxygenase [Jatrophihabitans sp.]
MALIANPLGSPLPLVAAPMSGGATTVRLAAAATEAGAFAFLAGGYKTSDTLAAEIAELRRRTDNFGVNLFAPTPSSISEADYRRYAEELRAEAERFGLDLPPVPQTDDDRWQDKLDLLLADPVPVVSVTFGLPRPADLAALRRAGSRLLVTVTTVSEARAAAEAGADALIVQGSDAGGHSGTHDPHRTITPTRTDELVRAVGQATGLPLLATGGVDGPRAVATLLDAGADAVAVGTLLLRTDESGASKTYQDALADPGFPGTVVTRAFTGRYARGLRNQFIADHEASAPAGYPAIHHLTRGLRQAAAAAGDPHRLHLWAGTGYRNARPGPARAVFEWLAGDL